jgi:peptidoglycan/xylan/chitin deacetylase (PgdA/CDA1 family)
MSFYPKEHILRQMPSEVPSVYLTFDDGPCDFTNHVLDALARHNAKATFFVIGQNAEKFPGIISRIIHDGHSIFSHSIDHNYSNYFKSEDSVSIWIKKSIDNLESLTGKNYPIFRPPAGIINPPVARSAKTNGVQLILWNHRFFDSIFELTIKKISKYLSKAKNGDIILLHDHQKIKNQSSFLISLDYLLTELKNKKLKLEKLNF